MCEVEHRVGAIDGIESVELVTDQGFQWAPSMMSESAKEARRERMRARIEQLKSETTVEIQDESIGAD